MKNLFEWNHNLFYGDEELSECEKNEELLDDYRKKLKKCEDELREKEKAKKTLQKRYDMVLQENKKLKEENDILHEEMDMSYGWIVDSSYEKKMEEEYERHEREQREFEEYDADREPSVVRHLLGDCIDYVSDIENVQDSHVESIKDMLESVMDNSLDVNKMSESDRLVLTKKLHSIKKNRKQMKQKLNDAMKAAEKATINNYYGSIGIKADRAEAIHAN